MFHTLCAKSSAKRLYGVSNKNLTVKIYKKICLISLELSYNFMFLTLNRDLKILEMRFKAFIYLEDD